MAVTRRAADAPIMRVAKDIVPGRKLNEIKSSATSRRIVPVKIRAKREPENHASLTDRRARTLTHFRRFVTPGHEPKRQIFIAKTTEDGVEASRIPVIGNTERVTDVSNNEIVTR